MNYQSPFAIPPGESIKDAMKNKGIKMREFAKYLHIKETYAKGLLSGEYPICSGIAQELARCFGGSEYFWLRLQENYAQTLYRINEKK